LFLCDGQLLDCKHPDNFGPCSGPWGLPIQLPISKTKTGYDFWLIKRKEKGDPKIPNFI